MINSNLKFKHANKDRLFYDRFQYSVGFNLSEVSCLRELNHQYIDIIIERRRQWRQVSLQRWGLGNSRNILANKTREIPDETVQNLHTLTDVLLRSRVEFKLVTSVSTAWIYTNDIALLETVDQLPFILEKTYSEAVVSRPKDTIKLKNPRHQNRAYLGNYKLTENEKVSLANFFNNQQEHVRISPSLQAYFDGSFHRTQDYFFFDYNEESWLMMLALIRPGLIRKTLSIIPR